MVIMAQSAVNWCNTHTPSGLHAFTHINTVTTTWCEVLAQLLHNFQSNFYFEGTFFEGKHNPKVSPFGIALVENGK